MFKNDTLDDEDELFWYESYELPCLKYTRNGVFKKRYDTVYEAANENNLGVYDIALCCSGKHISHNGYIWIFEKDKDINTLNLKVKSLKVNSKKVFRYEANGKYIDCFNSITEASINLNLNVGSISSVCNNKAYHCGGYIFSYFNDEATIRKKVGNILNKLKYLFCPISQWDFHGNLVAIYKNISDACSNADFEVGKISNVCNGNAKSYLGFAWRYEMYLFSNDMLLDNYDLDYKYIYENTEVPQYIQESIKKSKSNIKPRVFKFKHKYKSEQPKRRKSVICLTTGKIYESITMASEEMKACKICECCRNTRKSSGKLEDGTPLEWMYYEEYLLRVVEQSSTLF